MVCKSNGHRSFYKMTFPVKTIRSTVFTLLLILHASLAPAQSTVDDLKAYLTQRDEIKTLDLPALKTIAANDHEKNTRRGLAEYYIFLRTPKSEGDAAAGAKQADAFVQAADTYMDPVTYVKLATFYSQDFPDFGSKRDLTKCLRYLSISWEMADLSDKATGDNALLTLVINNTLGLGDGIFGNSGGKADLKKILDAIRPDVLKARERFKKMYGLSVKDEYPDSTNLERHYAQ